MTDTINHAEAFELASIKRDESNLARCYLDLRKQVAELKRFAQCACGDGFTTDDPGVCVNCLAAKQSKEQKPVLRHLTEGEREAIYHAFHPNPAVDGEDAKRYRWLRSEKSDLESLYSDESSGYLFFKSGEELDNAIDKAMIEAEQK